MPSETRLRSNSLHNAQGGQNVAGINLRSNTTAEQAKWLLSELTIARHWINHEGFLTHSNASKIGKQLSHLYKHQGTKGETRVLNRGLQAKPIALSLKRRIPLRTSRLRIASMPLAANQTISTNP
jgi:hypothetical protein